MKNENNLYKLRRLVENKIHFKSDKTLYLETLTSPPAKSRSLHTENVDIMYRLDINASRTVARVTITCEDRDTLEVHNKDFRHDIITDDGGTVILNDDEINKLIKKYGKRTEKYEYNRRPLRNAYSHYIRLKDIGS